MDLKLYTDKDNLLDTFSINSDLGLAPEKILYQIKEYINQNDIPDKKNEYWKNTNISGIFKHKFYISDKIKINNKIINNFKIPNLDAYKLVFINGNFVKEYSDFIDNEDYKITNSRASKDKEIFSTNYCKSELYKQNIFAAVNSAYSKDGAFIYLKENITLDKPIQIISFIDGDNQKVASQMRNIIYLSKNSKAQIIYTFHALSIDYSFNNIATEIFLSESSKLDFNIFQAEGDAAYQINNNKIIQSRSSELNMHTHSLCGAKVSNNIAIDLIDEYCTSNVYGIYLPDRRQHIDNKIFINHIKPNSQSNQIYRGILDDKSTSVFLGKVTVQKYAQKTDARQSNNNILLSQTARSYSKPHLEIYADDVKCSHGSTTGQLDDEQLFYLQTRGLDPNTAKTLLLYAFVSELIENISINTYKKLIKNIIDIKLDSEKAETCTMINRCEACEK